jgi:hypothetical protein
MNNEKTLDKMRLMHLFGMYDTFKTSLGSTLKETLTVDQFVAMLVSNEWDDRKNKAVERALKIANFRYKAAIEQIDYSFDRGLDQNQVHTASLSWNL